MFVQVGGGIRDEERIKQYLESGVSRVILGTIAVKDEVFLRKMVDKYKEKIVVGVDAKDGKVAINGWKEVTDIDSYDFCKELFDMGVSTVVYTDIARDGGLKGTNIQAYERLAKIQGLNVVASGGISFEDEIQKLASLVSAAILGKAIYSGMLDLKTCVKLSGE